MWEVARVGLFGGFLGFGGFGGGFAVIDVLAGDFVAEVGVDWGNGVSATGRGIRERALLDADRLEEEGRLTAEGIAVVVRGGLGDRFVGEGARTGVVGSGSTHGGVVGIGGAIVFDNAQTILLGNFFRGRFGHAVDFDSGSGLRNGDGIVRIAKAHKFATGGASLLGLFGGKTLRREAEAAFDGISGEILTVLDGVIPCFGAGGFRDSGGAGNWDDVIVVGVREVSERSSVADRAIGGREVREGSGTVSRASDILDEAARAGFGGF